ncbi:hypothetical protein CMQ_1189 [Grosmannia clavigera kw1407]|uniref:Uncharacterized protein n=1 Tax=Grosmannia clavigera (strain kw1407 / UAMH 11150) TaxID=655863 RepID=F0XF35_GROCL|nr:uncharacterized protein CMQ_1189 [Grosmannia clavigera kw1407]EFX04261.1 hypothetical protein CMQ_1189 [Grosmannia clavigera kw1407]
MLAWIDEKAIHAAVQHPPGKPSFVNGGLAKADMQVALIDIDQASSKPLDSSDIVQLLSQSTFASWLQGPEPQILYINGHLQLEQEQEMASPLTLLTCALYVSLQRHRSGYDIAAMHLCGQHAVPSDLFASIVGIMRSFAAQILYQLPADALDLSFIDLSFIEELSRGDPSALSRLLARLVSDAASVGHRVVILIDGVWRLEEGPAAPEFNTLVDFFKDLVQSFHARRCPYLKVLFTNPGSSIHARQWLADCPSSILDLDGAGFAGQGDEFGCGDDYYDDQQI